MATIKTKNSAGEWVEQPFTNPSRFNMIWVPKTSGEQSYDLSPYIKEEDDFILNFSCGFNSTVYGVKCQWLGSEGQLREINGSTQGNLSNNNSVSPLLSMSISSTRTHAFIYDKEARKFYVKAGSNLGLRLADYAVLIYAG